MKDYRADGGRRSRSALFYDYLLYFTFYFSFDVRFLATPLASRSMKSTETTDSSLLWVVKVAIIDFCSSFNVSAVILVTELIAFESIFDSPLDIPSVSLSPFTSFTLLFVFFLLTLLPELD